MDKKVFIGYSLACIAFLFACNDRKKESETQRIIPVKTMTVSTTNNAAARRYVGTVEEESSVSLSFQAQGTIEQIFVSEGQKVKEGDLLAQIHDANLQSAYNAALASFQQAEDAYKRLDMLHENQSLPEIKYIEAKSKLEQARSLVEIAEKNLKDSRLYAPSDGVIGKRSAEAGENIMPGMQVLSLLSINTVKIKIPVPEKEIASIRNDDEATIRIPALNNKTYSGKIHEKGIIAHPFSHTYEVKVLLENYGNELLPGMVGQVGIRHSGKNDSLIWIPNNAVQIKETNTTYVWCVKDAKATAVAVKTGELTEQGVVIISGLNDGDIIITEGYQKISEGMKIKEL